LANSVVTTYAREKLARARAGDATVPAITQMAFGNGGVDVNGDPIPPSATDVGLSNELLKKNVDGHSYPVATTCRYSCTLAKTDLAGENINEVGLFDADGKLVIKKTMTNKTKDGDQEMVFEIDDEF